ncbi:DUF1294 domain-containing protein [Cohnella xylanilytica]|uniref:DUF1294 domain-containing protein n=1 Tax=Cohnella xylanilytica TaxID=557555 RepID=A0A841U137_9BACL|nr:DUF1294 domain-containing protein [Cohnella xylanilytica]MBB6694487.1 DUF1294 domain-containing protein [Cohnella xylanilytica]
MILVLYLIIVNLVAFGLMGNDKRRAQAKSRRVPEKNLFLVAAIGGALGAWIGMKAFRHKTKHASFTIGIPALLVLNALCVGFILGLYRFD